MNVNKMAIGNGLTQVLGFKHRPDLGRLLTQACYWKNRSITFLSMSDSLDESINKRFEELSEEAEAEFIKVSEIIRTVI